MSKISRDKKKAEAKNNKTSEPKKTAIAADEPKIKSSIPNYGKCCTCKSYCRFPEGVGHMCKTSKKPCARKSTCDSYKCKI